MYAENKQEQEHEPERACEQRGIRHQARMLVATRRVKANRKRVGDQRIVEGAKHKDGAEKEDEFAVVGHGEIAGELHIEGEIA